MNAINSLRDLAANPSRLNSKSVKIIRWISQLVTLGFVIAMAWTITEVVKNGGSLPVWVVGGIVVFIAAGISLGVAVMVYKDVANEVGPFDFSPSAAIHGQLVSKNLRVETAEATSVRAEINMTAGTLELMGGTADFMENAVMDSTFSYDNADWKQPEVSYTVDAAGQGNLVVKQKTTGRPAMRQGRADWVIRLRRDLPADLKVKIGAGKAKLALAGMNLSGLRVEGGVGELTIDMSGDWQQNLSAFIKSGIGDTTLRLPEKVGVRVQTTVGLGSVKPNNLTWEGTAYTNELYGKSDESLNITVEGGMGKLTLEQ
jgi:hypothetical protein